MTCYHSKFRERPLAFSDVKNYQRVNENNNIIILVYSLSEKTSVDTKKDHPDKKKTNANNNRPITCLPVLWQILTVQIKEKIYD